jgi:hypothetical protein
MSKRAIGYTVTYHWCRRCVPEGISESYAPLREGDDAGIPYHCDMCDSAMLPCDHEWGEWMPAYDGRELRFCGVSDCQEAEYRGTPTAAAASPRLEQTGETDEA